MKSGTLIEAPVDSVAGLVAPARRVAFQPRLALGHLDDEREPAVRRRWDCR